MTKDELRKEAYLYAKNSKDVQNFECGFDIAFKSYLASAELREKEIKSLGKRCLQLQKDKGNLTDRVRELEQQIEQAKKNKVVEHFEAYGQCRDSRRIAELEAQIEKMKCCKEEIIKALKETLDYEWLHAHNGKVKYVYLQTVIDVVNEKFKEIKEK